ncbi:MAG: sigma-70 family RNA polymerase sigma factor [Verrucomicrobiota bacterium]|jgi:RNA polymerase sigma factor (sigma-70 family)
MTDSRALLVDYAENGTESAFRDLVARYIDLVFSTALRQVGGDAHLAQDVAQTVFLHLARKARSLPQGVMLGGWLYQTTCNVAATITRAERRRQAREREAVQMNTFQRDSTSTLDHVAPILDEVIGLLPDEDRTAVLLRFFEKRDFRSVGQALGSSEDAARMRVNRALEKLGVLLKQRGVTISATALGTALATEAVTAAPVGLAATVAGSALAGVGAASAASLNFLKIMAISKLQLGAIGVIVIGGLTTALVLQHQSLARYLEDSRSLQQQVQDLRDAKDQLARAQVDQAELEKLRRNQSELLRLRGEVSALRKASGTTALPVPVPGRSQPGTSAAPDAVPGILRLQANLQTQVGTGQTLLTGGWANGPGKRVFVLATPRIEGENKDQVHIQTWVIEVPETELAKLGLDAFTVEGSESSLKQVMPADQAKGLMDALQGMEGAKMVAQSNITTGDGRQTEIQSVDQQVVEGVKQDLGPVINIVPVISGDKSTIHITLQAGINQVAAKVR